MGVAAASAVSQTQATVVGTAKLDGYELAFRRGYLTILPKEGASVEGLIWSITDHDESQLDCYEGYPKFYDKETMTVTDMGGKPHEIMVYTMNEPYRDQLLPVSSRYTAVVLQGCLDAGISPQQFYDADEKYRKQIAWQVVDATNTNLRTSVDISKQDITNGKELPGAKLEIRDAGGNLVEGWISGKVPHTVRGLEPEKEYTLTEKCAPEGYAEAESIVFKLVQNGTEQVNEVCAKSNDGWVKLDDTTVIMQDAPVLDIDKTDMAGNLLPGATLTIRDADGEVIDTWVTDYKTHSVPILDDFIKLSDDNRERIYTLTEDAAPAGFEIAESVQFKLESVDEVISLFVRENADAEWVRADKRFIQMIDEAIPRENAPTPTPAPTPQPTPAATPEPTPVPTPVITPHKVQTLPQTGDSFPLLAIVVVSLVSATGIVLLTVKQKNALKETSDEEDADESSDR